MSTGTSDNTPLSFSRTRAASSLVDARVDDPEFRALCAAGGVSVGQVRRARPVVGECRSVAEVWAPSGRDQRTGLTVGTLQRCWLVLWRAGLIEDAAPTPTWGSMLSTLVAPLGADARMALLTRIAMSVLTFEGRRHARAVADLNREQRSSKSWHLPAVDHSVDGRSVRTLPVWTSRPGWLRQVEVMLDSEHGRRVRGGSVSVHAVKVVAQIIAEHADSRTGRHVTVSEKEIVTQARRSGQQVSQYQVTRSRRWLRGVGLEVVLQHGRKLSVEEIAAAHAHHGGRQLAVASEVALVSPREVVTQVSATAPLPRSSHLRSLSSCSGVVTKRACARGKRSSTQKPVAARRGGSVRPLPLQRLVAGLVGRCAGLDRGEHLGRLCDVVAGAGIDPQRWSAHDVAEVLDQQGRQRRWDWPDAPTSASGFLRYRLSLVDWRQEVPPSEVRAAGEARRRAEQQQRAQEVAAARPASAQARAAARELFAASRRSR